MQYHVFCTNPGMHRGGRANPPHASYAEGDHTPAQLRELLHDKYTHVVLGGELLTEASMTSIELAAAVQSEAETQAKARTAPKKGG